MYDLLFGFVLFWVLFSIGCCAIAEPNTSSVVDALPDKGREPVDRDKVPSGSTAAFDVELKALMDEVFSSEPSAEERPVAYILVLPSIDVDSLTVLQARRISKLLGLPQKAKRKDISLAKMRAQIAERLRTRPEDVRQCAEALKAAA